MLRYIARNLPNGRQYYPNSYWSRLTIKDIWLEKQSVESLKEKHEHERGDSYALAPADSYALAPADSYALAPADS